MTKENKMRQECVWPTEGLEVMFGGGANGSILRCVTLKFSAEQLKNLADRLRRGNVNLGSVFFFAYSELVEWFGRPTNTLLACL